MQEWFERVQSQIVISLLLLFASPSYLFPVKNVHAEWFSFGKCDLTEPRRSMVMCSFSRRLKRKQTGLQAKLESCGCLDLESRCMEDKLNFSKLAWSIMHKIHPYKRNWNLRSFILNKALFKGEENSLLKSLDLLPLMPAWMICNICSVLPPYLGTDMILSPVMHPYSLCSANQLQSVYIQIYKEIFNSKIRVLSCLYLLRHVVTKVLKTGGD